MKKFISLLLALVMALSLVVCGAKNDTKTDDTANPNGEVTPTNALEQIKADGVLTVALSPDFSPMEFVGSSKIGQDQYVGFDVTLAKYIAAPGRSSPKAPPPGTAAPFRRKPCRPSRNRIVWKVKSCEV